MTIIEALELFYYNGNVGRSVDDLADKKPTIAKINDACQVAMNKGLALPLVETARKIILDYHSIKQIKIGIMGPGRAGKDEAADWFTANTNLRYQGTTSIAISRKVARDEGTSFIVAHTQRHKRREEWRRIGDEMRVDDPSALAKEVLIGSELLVGVRAEIELDAIREQGFVDIIFWIDNPRVDFDPTMGFNEKSCDVIIPNRWDLPEYHARLKVIAKSYGLLK